MATPRNVQLPRFEKSSFATLKQHGSEGQDEPPGDGLYCLTSLSEAVLKLQKNSYLFAFAAACSWPFLPSLLALAAWRPRLETFSCQGSKKAALPHSNSMAVRDRTGLRVTACTAAFWSHKKLYSYLFAFAPAFSCLLALAPGPSCSPFLLLLPDGRASKRSAAKVRKKQLCHIQTAWQWGTGRASGRRPVLPNVALQETSYLFAFAAAFFLLPSCSCSWPFLLSLLALAAWRPRLETFSCQGSKKAASPQSNSMAVKDGTGLRATACTA